MENTLNAKIIKQIVNAYVEMKRAEEAFKKLKETHLSELQPGRYESDYGCVIKTAMQKTTTDWKKLIWDNPQIDVTPYNVTKDVTSVIVQNYNTKKGLFS